MFNEGRENVHDEVRSGCPSFVNDDLVRKVNERLRDVIGDGFNGGSDFYVQFRDTCGKRRNINL